MHRMEYSKGHTACILRETGKCSVLAQIVLVSSCTLTGLQSWVTVVNIRYDAEQYPDLGVGWNCKCIPYHKGLRFRGRHNFI